MGTSLPNGRWGRVAAVGVTLAVAVMVWLAAVTPLRDLFLENAESLAQQQAVYLRMLAIANRVAPHQAPAARGLSTGNAEAMTRADATFDEGTDAVAGAALQQQVQEMAGRIGALLSSTEALPSTAVQGYHRIGLRIALNAPWTVLIGLMQAIGEAHPLMLVDDLQVHGQRTLAQPVEPPLDIRFTVVAFRADGPSGGQTP